MKKFKGQILAYEISDFSMLMLRFRNNLKMTSRGVKKKKAGYDSIFIFLSFTLFIAVSALKVEIIFSI
jgi:hypothetical protein